MKTVFTTDNVQSVSFPKLTEGSVLSPSTSRTALSGSPQGTENGEARPEHGGRIGVKAAVVELGVARSGAARRGMAWQAIDRRVA